MDLTPFLQEDKYIDFTSEIIQDCGQKLFSKSMGAIEKARTAYFFVRDEIPHSFDIKAKIITVKASQVLRQRTGICHAKANLLAALLRSQGIPADMCFQRLTLLDDDTEGYCVHCYNAMYLKNRWVYVDARGNTNGKNARFSLEKPVLAFANRPEYEEFFYPHIYALSHLKTMATLEKCRSMKEVMAFLPDHIDDMKALPKAYIIKEKWFE